MNTVIWMRREGCWANKKSNHNNVYLMEKIVKLYKTHRSAADFESGFLSQTVNTMKEIKSGVEGTSPKD